MRAIHCFLLATLLACPLPTLAQQAPPIQEAMTPEEFSQAGLDKLSATELARLNAWLDRRVEQQTSAAVAAVAEQAREEGRKEVVEKNRGFFHFNSDEPITATITGEFNGFGKGKRYRLDNGQVWEQTDTATLAGVRRTDPQVSIRPGLMGTWYLKIDGYNTRAKVTRIE